MIVAILIVAALVLFIIDSFGVASRINLQSAGLACLTLALLLRSGVLG